jgi:predicted CoA-binding protein
VDEEVSGMNPAIADFLAQRNIAVAGVSRKGPSQPANLIYRKLRDGGYRVFPVNPATDQIEGGKCYPNLASIPEALDGVVIATRPEVTEKVVEECIKLGVPRVWMHRSFGEGSVSERAIANCKSHQIKVIEGGCPMMSCSPVDLPHRCMRWFLGVTGRLAA